MFLQPCRFKSVNRVRPAHAETLLCVQLFAFCFMLAFRFLLFVSWRICLQGELRLYTDTFAFLSSSSQLAVSVPSASLQVSAIGVKPQAAAA